MEKNKDESKKSSDHQKHSNSPDDMNKGRDSKNPLKKGGSNKPRN